MPTLEGEKNFEQKLPILTKNEHCIVHGVLEHFLNDSGGYLKIRVQLMVVCRNIPFLEILKFCENLKLCKYEVLQNLNFTKTKFSVKFETNLKL